MSRYFLTQLTIEGFRGINNCGAPLDLRFRSDAVNSIWAPNGLGKSSIFEALCYAIRGEVPKLARLEASEKPEEYYCNLFHGGNATITLTFSPDDGSSDVVIEVIRSPSGVRSVASPSGHSNPEALLKSLDEDHTLLDYTTFATFMENSSLDRGRSFSSLLGMAHLSKVRQALEQLSNKGNLSRDFDIPALTAERQRLEAEHQAAIHSIRTHYATLTAQVPTDPLDIDSLIANGTAALSAVPLLAAEFESHTLIDVPLDALTEKIRSAEGGGDREKLVETIRQAEWLRSLSPGDEEASERDQLGALIEERDKALKETRGDLFQRLYRAVKVVLDSDQWTIPTKCPACESTLSRPLTEHIATQLAAFTAVSEKAQEAARAWSNSGCARRLRDLEAEPSIAVPEEEREYGSISNAFRQGTASKQLITEFNEHLDTLETSRQAALSTLESERTRLERDLPSSLVVLVEQLEAAKNLRNNIITYQHGVDERGRKAQVNRQLRQRERWSSFIDAATNEFAAAETAFSRNQTAALESRYQEMYAAVIQGNVVVPTLRKPSGTERLDLRLERFFDLEDLAARPLLSESYRNAFGIAVFLSAALEKRSTARFIVLDDITSSFDAGHQWFLMELLRTKVGLPENNTGVQLIILSHDGLLEKYFDKLSNQDSWYHHRLQGQSPTGAVLSEAQEANRLRADAERFLDAGQIRQAEPLIRQYLEFKLMQIINKVRIPVPLDFVVRDDRRTVQYCLDSITEAVRLHEAAGDLILDAGQLSALRSTHVPSLVGNWLSHYETGSIASLAPSVLRGVLTTIDNFAECFRYHDPTSGNRRYYRALKH